MHSLSSPMIPLPASAEPAANAGTGPEGHKRSSSVDSGASSDATIVVASIDWIDDADMGAVDGCHKLVATGQLLTLPPEPPHERAASDPELAAHDAKRGRVSTDTASGAPALATHTTTAGSPTAAAPITVSIYTATALAVADPYANALDEPNEASDAGHDEGAPAHSAAAAAASDAAAAAASSAGSDAVVAQGTPPALASSDIVNFSIVNHDLAPASASSSTGATSALGSAASASATIVANETSRGDVGSPETPVISRRSHAVAIRAFSIGRTSTPAPAPQASGSKSAVIVANAASRGDAHCPSTPVISRLPMPLSHGIPGTAALPAVQVNRGQYSAFAIGLRCSATSAAASTPAAATTPAVPPTPATAPAVPPMPATAMSPRLQPQSSPARFSVLRTVSRVIRRGVVTIRNALIALYTDGIGSTNREHSTSPGRPDEDGCGGGDAPIDAVLLGLRRRERRRFL